MPDFSLTTPQSWAHQAFHSRPGLPNTVNLVWSRGSGKSWFERFEGIWLPVAENIGKVRASALKPFKGVRIIGLCPTLKQFRDIHGAKLHEENEGDWKFLGGKLNHSTLRIDWPDGSWFQPMPAASASSKAALGQRCDYVLLDEADDIASSVYHTVVQPWFTEPWSFAQILSGGTPRRGRHGLLYELHRLGISADPLDARYSSKVFTWRDSPEIIRLDQIEDAKRNMPPAVFAREYECDFDSAEGLVYPFEEDFHVRAPDENVRFLRFAIGGDHGWNDPGVLLFGGIAGHGNDSIIWILEEHYASERPNHEWDAIVTERYHGVRGWLDPSRPDRINDYRRAGLDARPADNSIEAGVARIAELLFRRKVEDGEDYARLYIHPRCVNTIREFKSYRRKQDPQNKDRYLEDIVDKNNHAMDALRYMVVGEFGRSLSRRGLVADS